MPPGKARKGKVLKKPAAAPAKEARAEPVAVLKKPAGTEKRAAAASRPEAAKKKKTGEGVSAAAEPNREGTFPHKTLAKIAQNVWKVYFDQCAFPSWSINFLADGMLDKYAKKVTVYFKAGDSLAAVKKVAMQREPANVAMRRCYDEERLEELLGYRRGAYADGGEHGLMPNIAVYCKTPMRLPEGDQVEAHVINIIGYAFDSPMQPDYKYFMPLHSRKDKWNELVLRMMQMWRFVFECAKRKGLSRVYLADVGGGAFAHGLDQHHSTCYIALKASSLPPVIADYPDIEVNQLQRIPDWCFSAKGKKNLKDSLLVNAWDPWSLVGNANRSDNSLDGFFGRCTAMAVLCWPRTNPLISYESVG